MNSKYTQETRNIWFPDQREPIYNPSDPETHRVFTAYWAKERDRIMNGFTIADGKFKVTGWLYWHTVYWKIRMYTKVAKRNIPEIKTPKLRDIDLEAAINFEKALDDGRFIELVGSRGFGKTVWQSSYAAMIYTMIDKSQVVVSAGNNKDIATVTDMISQGLTQIHPIWNKKRLKNNWKEEVLAGWKDSDNIVDPDSSLSQIVICNYRDGNEPQAANGKRPNFHIIDEIGKIGNFIKCVKDSDGCWWAIQELDEADDGVARPTCLPMFTGTGGEMLVAKEAAEMFFNPYSYNLLDFDDIWENTGKIGWFMPVTKARNEYKFPQTLAKYLNIDHPDLEKITIMVSDEEKCYNEWYLPGLRKAEKSGNTTTILSFKAYWPTKPSDSFIVLNSNNFDIDSAKRQLERIKASDSKPSYVELFNDNGEIKHKFSKKLPITQFPTKDQPKDTPIQVWEFPDYNPPFGLYVGGVDPYRQALTASSDSLGAVYIIKRMHDIQSERYQDMIVASYVGRPDRKEDWEDQARLLIKWYNARTLVENDEYSFIEYMKTKGDAMYLERQPEWLKEIVPNSGVKREYGIHRSSDRIREHLHDSLRKYMAQVLHVEKDDKGSIIKEFLGTHKILDPMLLQEIIAWNADDNFDRVIAVELAFALARHLDPIIGKVSDTYDPRFGAYFNKSRNTNKLFSTSNTRLKSGGRISSLQKMFT